MNRVWKIVILVAFLVLFFGGALARFYTDWLWFGEVGYRTVFWTRLESRALLGVVAGLLFFAIVYANLWLARRVAPPTLPRYGDSDIRVRMSSLAQRGFGLLLIGLTLGVSVLVALEASTHWLSFQMAANAAPFGETDPIFRRDIGFYVFTLPFMRYLYGWLFFALVVAALSTTGVYYIGRAIDMLAGRPTFAPNVKAHLSLLFAAVLFTRAWGYRLDAYDLLYSPTGVVFGAGYTDVHARLVALNILAVVAVIAGILALVNIYRRGVVLPVAALAILVGASLLVGAIYPAIIQGLVVKPNEIARESRYITNNIDATRRAFNLDVIEDRSFPATTTLTARDLDEHRTTINSVRLWDYRPIQSTYNQLQALWQFFTIQNVDIDRYTVNGELRQVMLAARELSTASTTGASTWVNRRFQYTHGYGAVMSPVNRATTEGMPEFFVHGMPPVSNVGIEIDRPEIYFGELMDNYVIVDSNEMEFDFPSAGKPTYTSYAGTGGINIGSRLNRMAFAWRFGEMSLVLNNPIEKRSRVIFRRQIQDRVNTIFPFLRYDFDPYLVIADGKLYWMWDAYTTTSRYPYSRPVSLDVGDNVNYIRNSVKVVIDAYNGTVDYYVADTNDPILKTYSRIFPGVFKPMGDMPADLRAHIRYPELMFRIQSGVLLVYHMTDPQVFYNKSDRWDIPKEMVGTSNQLTPMEPYYVVMTLPGEKKEEEFVLMIPFTPVDKDNMIAWMAAKSGPEDYGKVILYQFPKGELVYGPAMVESRINQDAVISQQLSLWNQLGSRVNRGNQLIIPIGKSIVYVKPLYLQSESAQMPELKRVIVGYGNQLAMEPTLQGALNKIFGGAPADTAPTTEAAPPQTPSRPGGALTEDIRKLIEQAVQQFDRAQQALRNSDWSGYGTEQQRLRQTLKELQEAQGGGGR